MPQKLSGFIASIAKAAGLPETNPELVKITEALKDKDFEIDSVFENIVHSNLMSMDAAKSNPSLNTYFNEKLKGELWAQALGPVDDKIHEGAKALELDDYESLRNEKDTRKKIATLVDRLKDSYEKKGKSSGDKAAIEKERAETFAKIKELETRIEDVRKEEQGKYNCKLTDSALRTLLASYQYGLPEEIPQDVILETAKNLLNRKLEESKFKFNYNPDNNNFGLTNETGQQPYINSAPVEFKSFVDKVLADGNLLKVSGAPAQQPAQTQTTSIQSGADFSESNDMMKSQLAAFK